MSAGARSGLLGALGLLVLAAACTGPRVARPIGSCAHLQAVREVRGTTLCEDAWTCLRPPGGRFDRVALHRLARCEEAGGPVVLYLPGMHMNAELPETDPQHDLRVYLAVAGVRTWGLDYRTHAVPADVAPADLEVMRGWTPDLFLGDVAWAAGFIRGNDPGPLRVAGFSQGASLAYRLASRRDQSIDGLLILDGALGTGAAAEDGEAAIDVGGSRLPFPLRQRLLAEVLTDPTRPSPLPGFATAGEALTETLYTAPSFGGHGGLANARDGLSDVRVLAGLLARYDRWWPRAMLAGHASDTPARPLPVLAFASTNLGPAWVERVRVSARTFGGPQAIVRELPGYGHLDVIVGRRSVHDVFMPALSWLGNGSPSAPLPPAP